ncbi:hypothetical protein BJ684DRAFT_3056, partial [Piptocephalis cylindrospora]
PAVAQSAINGSKMSITSANITSPQEDSFVMRMSGLVTDTGPFDAEIEMAGPIQVYSDGVLLGEMIMDPISSKAGVGAKLESSPTFRVTNKEGFGDFSGRMLRTESFTWTLDGQVNIIAMGMTLTGIRLRKEITMKGMGNFPGPVTVQSMRLTGGNPDYLVIEMVVGIISPSNVGISVGHVEMDAYYSGHRMGRVIIPDMVLKPGMNSVSSRMHYAPQDPSAVAAGRDLLSKYVMAQDSVMGVAGTEDSTTIQSLRPALQAIRFTTVVPGLRNQPLIKQA